jgi:hypothetical protein
MHDEDGGDGVHQDMPRQYLRCGATAVHGTCKGKWAHRRRSRAGMHTHAPTVAKRVCTGGWANTTGALRGVRGHARDYHAHILALPATFDSPSGCPQ